MEGIIFYGSLSYREVKDGLQGLHKVVSLVRRIRTGILNLVKMPLVKFLQWKIAELLTEPVVLPSAHISGSIVKTFPMRGGFVPGNNPRHGPGMFARWCSGLDFRARRGGYVVLPEFWGSDRTTQAYLELTFSRRPIVNNLLSVPRTVATNVFDSRSRLPNCSPRLHRLLVEHRNNHPLQCDPKLFSLQLSVVRAPHRRPGQFGPNRVSKPARASFS